MQVVYSTVQCTSLIRIEFAVAEARSRRQQEGPGSSLQCICYSRGRGLRRARPLSPHHFTDSRRRVRQISGARISYFLIKLTADNAISTLFAAQKSTFAL